jgi:hypothetical protein
VDLVSIARALWRCRRVTIPTVALVLVGSFYVLVLAPRQFATATTVVLFEPAPLSASATPAEQARRSANTYLQFTDRAVVADVVARVVESDAVRDDLKRGGSSGDYRIVRSAQFGTSSPVVDIEVVASTARAAVRDAVTVAQRYAQELRRLQDADGAGDQDMIVARTFGAPEAAHAELASKSRALAALLGLGLGFVVLAVSFLERRRPVAPPAASVALESPEVAAPPARAVAAAKAKVARTSPDPPRAGANAARGKAIRQESPSRADPKPRAPKTANHRSPQASNRAGKTGAPQRADRGATVEGSAPSDDDARDADSTITLA